MKNEASTKYNPYALLAIVIAIVIIVGGYFYYQWFQWNQVRPAQIRSDCAKNTHQVYPGYTGLLKTPNSVLITASDAVDLTKSYYDKCLHEHGL